jgi:hypothetical protein
MPKLEQKTNNDCQYRSSESYTFYDSDVWFLAYVCFLGFIGEDHSNRLVCSERSRVESLISHFIWKYNFWNLLRNKLNLLFIFLRYQFNCFRWFQSLFLWDTCSSIFYFLCSNLSTIVCHLFEFGHCIVCPSNFCFWLSHWSLQIVL